MASQDQSKAREEAREDLRQRVIYALLLPSTRLAQVFGVSLKDMDDLMQMAYYHEHRRKKLKMHEISARMGVSMRKVAQLSKRLKLNFLSADESHGLPRRVEFMLWAGPLSAARLRQAMPTVESSLIDEALESLAAQGRVSRRGGRVETYEVVRSRFRLVDGASLPMLDGLGNLLGNLSAAVYARFFERDEDAFARTVSFRVRREDRDALRLFYERTLWPALVALDESARDDPEAMEMDLSILWAPYNYFEKQAERDDEGIQEGGQADEA